MYFKNADFDISNNDVTQKSIKIMFLVVLLIKLCVLIIVDNSKKMCCTKEKMLFSNSLNQFLMTTIIVEK